MPETEYPYPPDQFDREAEVASFHGAHRAEEPFWRQNLVYLIVIAAAILTLLVLLFVIGGLGGKKAGDEASTAPAQQTSASAASDQGGDQPAAQADLTTPVLVINASGQQGLAGDWRDKLTGEGWTDVDIQTAQKRQQDSVVYYRDEKDAASAQALAQSVGVGQAQQSDDYDARITFVAVKGPEG